ncbi:CinA family protein [Brevibacterium daeguense]|uniref:CinA family protein n=1 Tax=Brevibacterium daeguense TaxID=909936 RepID=A0ABP8EKL9_9MICO|nr:CinA family protein [Brevibacterium daeguense]
MPSAEEYESEAAEVAGEISKLADEHGFTVAVAESLTGGKIAQQFSAAEHSSDWFAGGVVAYQTEVKHSALGVPRGPVISEEAVKTMATGVAEMMNADAVIAASGSGGPEKQEGNEPGTTWLAVLVRGIMHTELHHFSGDPLEVLAKTQDRVLPMLRDAMREAVQD